MRRFSAEALQAQRRFRRMGVEYPAPHAPMRLCACRINTDVNSGVCPRDRHPEAGNDPAARCGDAGDHRDYGLDVRKKLRELRADSVR